MNGQLNIATGGRGALIALPARCHVIDVVELVRAAGIAVDEVGDGLFVRDLARNGLLLAVDSAYSA